MKYLVTGGCGFIGSHLVDALVARGERVVVLDNLSTGRLENLNPRAEFIKGDILSVKDVENATSGIDCCFHLAAIASVELANKYWLQTHTVNLTGTIRILEQSAASNKFPVVYASSAAVYGNPQTVPLGEDSALCPLNAYGADKLGCELHANVAWGVHGVPVMGLRFFNVYGRRQDPNSPYSGVISIFTKLAMEGKALNIFGDGEQTRDFVYVDDVVNALVKSMDSNVAESKIYNVCTGKKTSLLELARVIGEVLGADLELRHLPARVGDIKDSIGNPKLIEKELGVKCEVNLKEGLKKLLMQ
jgi:UDP-glucose 4-epimerase